MILIVDGMGGGMGRAIAEGLRQAGAGEETVLVGTNSFASSNMMKSGISTVATGENAVIYNAGRADIIAGPIGIILPNALLGEISPAMARAVAESSAKKVLIPIQNDSIYIAGADAKSMAKQVEDAVALCLSLRRG